METVWQLFRRNRNFAFLWFAVIAAGLADTLFSVGVMVNVYEQTGSAVQTVGVTVATTISPFLLAPFVGAVVDRFSRRMLLIVVNLLRVGVVGGFLLLMGTGDINVWLMYIVVALLAVGTTISFGARQALLPQIAPPAQLVTANSLLVAVLPLTMAAAFLIGGLLVGLIGLRGMVLIVMVAFGVASGLFVPIRPSQTTSGNSDTQNEDESNEPFFESIRSGFQYLRTHALARPLTIMETVEHIPHGIWTAGMLLVFVERALGGDSADWGAQNAAFATAMVVSSMIGVFASRWISRRPGWFIIVNAFITALFTLIYSQSPNNLFAIIVAFLFGLPMGLRDVAQDALLQTSVDNGVIGRVYAFRDMGRSIMFMSSSLFFAWLSDFVPIRSIYMAASVMYVFTALYALANQPLRHSQIAVDNPSAEAKLSV